MRKLEQLHMVYILACNLHSNGVDVIHVWSKSLVTDNAVASFCQHFVMHCGGRNIKSPVSMCLSSAHLWAGL